MPQLVAGASFLFSGAGFGAITSVFGIQAGTLGFAALRIGASLLLSSASRALFGPKVSAQDVSQQLGLPTNAPAYRFVYGRARAMGTPVGTPIRGDLIWGCWLLNSRPSDLSDFKLFLDKREVLRSGDPFDFTMGGGASATTFPFLNHCKFWIGRGDQTSPPAELLAGAPWSVGNEDLWLASDAWKGRTVIWMRLAAGGSKNRQQRWPSAPPMVEMEGKFSKVWDLRDGAQSLANPATWTWSENHALCTLDAATQSPVRPYQLANLHLPSWIDGANVADQDVALLAGGTEKRYTASGTLVFSGQEVEDLLNPMFISGAADVIRIGGKLGYAAGAYRAPAVSLNYLLGQGFEAVDMIEGDSLVNELRVAYVSPQRGYEVANLKPYSIPGALAADGGLPAVRDAELSFCKSPTQAMRVRKIMAGRLRRQERLTGGELPPEALDLVGGATLTLSLPAPYDVLGGIYEVESVHPAFDLLGDSGMAVRIPAKLVKHSAAIYDWNPATDEEALVEQPYNSARAGIALPGVISVTTGAGVDLNTGGTIIPRFRFAFDPSPSAGLDGYEWQYRIDGGNWTAGGVIGADVLDGSGKVFDYLVASVGHVYDIQVSALSSGQGSDWRQALGLTVSFAIAGAAASAGLGNVTVSGTAPLTNVQGVKVYRSAVGAGFGTAVAVSGVLAVAAGAAFSFTVGETGAVNLFTNTSFASGASGWTLGAGWSVASGVATHVGPTGGSLTQALALTAALTYRLACTVSGRTLGTLTPQIVGGSVVSAAASSANGLLVGSIVAPASPASARFTASATFNGSVDDVVIFAETVACLAQGPADFYIVPVSLTGVEGSASGPFTLTIP